MKAAIVFTIFLGLVATQIDANPVTAAESVEMKADFDASHRSVAQLAEAVYVGGPIECTVVEVATQYVSTSFDTEIQCIAKQGDTGGLEPGFYELEGLSPDFVENVQGKLNSGKARLTASHLYKVQHKLIFTMDTVWSLDQTPKH